MKGIVLHLFKIHCFMLLFFIDIRTNAQTLMPLPAHASVYSAIYARGLWFTSPTDFVITGLKVSPDAGAGLQYIHVVKFSGVPVTSTAGSNNFTTLVYISNATNNVIQPVNIPITTGDVIGILGTVGNIQNSYGNTPFSSSVNGFSFPLYRLGYQGSINGGAAPNMWGATTGQIGRIEVYWTLPSSGPNDAGVTSIDSPAGGCEGLYNVVATVKNFGINQIDTVTVNWSHNSTLQTPVTIYNLLDTFNGLGSQTAQVNLGSLNLIGGQSDTLRVWTTLPNNVTDSITDNDSAMKSFNSLSTITSFPYYEDFESSQGEWFIGGTNSSWAYGNPAKATITGAASGLNAFVTGGLSTGQYNINENSWVASPCFDLSGFEGTVWVAADIWWNAEFSFDGAVLQSSVDGGKSWQNVGSYQDPHKWYNDNTITGNPGGQQTGWSGRASTSNGSGGWVMAKNTLNVALSGGPVRFRIAFGSEGSINDDGFAFDNFRIVDFQKVNLGPDVVSLCGNPNYTLDPGIDTINGRIWWSTLDSVNRSISVTNPDTIWVKYTDDMINETDYDTIIIVQSTPPSIGFVKAVDTIAIDSQITLDPNLPFDLNFIWSPGGYNFPYLLLKGSDLGLGSFTYKLKVTDSLYCEDLDSITVVVTPNYTGINENLNSEFIVYPNPVTDKLNVVLNNQSGGISEVSLFDLQGKIIFEGKFSIGEKTHITVDMNKLPAGSFVLHIKTANKLFREQIIKLK